MNKPTVRYEGEAFVSRVGGSAFVKAVDHPSFPAGSLVTTSAVVAHDPKTGRIETRNTVYMPLQEAI